MKLKKESVIFEAEQQKQTKDSAEDTTITVNGKVGEENSDIKVDDKKAQETNTSVGTNVADDAEKSISELLVNAGWTKKENGTFVKDDFSDQFSAGISIDIQESRGFERFAQQLIFEATGDINLTVKVKNKKTEKEDSFTHTFNAGQLKSADDIQGIISKFIQEKVNGSEKSSNNQNNAKTNFLSAWEKLSDEEQDAFIEFYGDKLVTLLRRKRRGTCKMNEFEKIYLDIVSEEKQEVSLNGSTELVDESEVTNESLGKWAKNTFTKFGKKSLKKEMDKTIKEFRNQYKFERFDEDSPKLYGKMIDGYLVTVKFNNKDFKTGEMFLSVISPKSKKPVEDFKNLLIPFKHSNTVKELAKKLNQELSQIDIEITNAEGHVPEDFFESNNVKQQSEQTGQSNNSIPPSEAFNKVATASGFEPSVFKDKLNQVEGDKPQKIKIIKSLISGWKKLDENERKLFQQLQK